MIYILQVSSPFTKPTCNLKNTIFTQKQENTIFESSLYLLWLFKNQWL